MQFLAIWRDLLGPILAQPTTWTLRDFHSPNLHWLAERPGLKRIGLIDFQDARDCLRILHDRRPDFEIVLLKKRIADCGIARLLPVYV